MGPEERRLSTSASGRVAATTLGPYTLVRELARGGMGAVWVARRPGLDREVALKLLLGEGDPAQVERFKAEARIAARLRHPHVVAIHDVGEDRGRHYLVMDLIRGESLQARLERQGPLEPRHVAELGVKLARALAWAHAQAVLHRDLKPHNVLIDERGEPLLTDFGLAKDTADERGLTRTGQIMGTPAYMAPEQAEGQPDLIDRRTDVYSLGATLYAALTGRPPFEGSTGMALIAKVLTAAPPAPRALRPELDRDLETIVLRCLEKEPEARYPSALALAEDLERWLADEPIAARRPGALERAARWARRNRAAARAFVVAGAAIVGALAISGALLVRARLARERAGDEARAALAQEARLEQEQASRAAEELAPTGSAALALPPDERARALEPLLGRRLAAFVAAQRWQVLAPADPLARERRLEAGLALGEAARQAGQWTLADQAFADAAGLAHPRRGEGEAGRRAVVDAREEASRARMGEARAVLDQVERGAHLERTDGLMDAVFALVRHPEADVVDEVCARLARVTSAERDATRRFYLAAQPTPEEQARGWRPVDGLDLALEDWLLRGDAARGAPALRAAEDVVARRIKARRRADVLEQRFDPRVDLSREQELELRSRELSYGVDLAHVCCEALGRIGPAALERCGRLEAAVSALGAYLSIEAHPGRTLRAGLALARLGGPRAEALLRAALAHHGSSSPFVTQARDTPELKHLFREGSGPGRAIAREAVEPVSRARELAGAGQLDEALLLLNEAASHATGPEARRTLEEARLRFLLNVRRTAEALPALDALISAEPGHAPWRLMRGVARRLDGDLTGARAELERALELAPRWAEVRVQLAELLVRAGDGEGAGREVEEALRLEPDDAQALSTRSVVRRERGDLEGALQDATRAVQLDPLLGEAWLRLAKMSGEAGQAERAEQAFDRAARLFPGQAFVWAQRGHLRAVTDRPEAGLEDLERALEMDPGLAEAWSSKGLALLLLGRAEPALAALDRALELDPRQVDALLHRATVHGQMGRIREAMVDADRAVEVAPQDVGVRILRAKLQLHAGGLDRAWEDLEVAARLDPRRAETFQLRALVQDGLGRPSEAEREFQRATEADPDDPRVHTDLATFLVKQRRLPQARTALDRALALAPDLAQALRLRGLVRAQLGEREGAIADLERFLQRAPGSPHADEVRAALARLRR